MVIIISDRRITCKNTAQAGFIKPISESDYARDWRNWQKYKAENAEMFARIDADLLQEHLQIAEEWP